MSGVEWSQIEIHLAKPEKKKTKTTQYNTHAVTPGGVLCIMCLPRSNDF